MRYNSELNFLCKVSTGGFVQTSFKGVVFCCGCLCVCVCVCVFLCLFLGVLFGESGGLFSASASVIFTAILFFCDWLVNVLLVEFFGVEEVGR